MANLARPNANDTSQTANPLPKRCPELWPLHALRGWLHW